MSDNDCRRETAIAAVRLLAAIGYVSQDGDPVCEFCCCHPYMDMRSTDWHAANCPTRAAMEWVRRDAED